MPIYLHMETRILLYKLLLTQSVKTWHLKVKNYTCWKNEAFIFSVNTMPWKLRYFNQHTLVQAPTPLKAISLKLIPLIFLIPDNYYAIILHPIFRNNYFNHLWNQSFGLYIRYAKIVIPGSDALCFTAAFLKSTWFNLIRLFSHTLKLKSWWEKKKTKNMPIAQLLKFLHVNSLNLSTCTKSQVIWHQREVLHYNQRGMKNPLPHSNKKAYFLTGISAPKTFLFQWLFSRRNSLFLCKSGSL